MNKRKGSNFLIVLITSTFIFFRAVEALADHTAPEVQTQINERTDLFEKSINDLPEVERQLEGVKQEALKSLGSGMPQGLSSITKKSKSELAAESNKLESIREHDLDGEGRKEMIKKNVLNELYPDYKRPLNKQYMEDAKAIAAGQNKLLDNLLGKLKELGVDCKAIKGDVRHEAEYFLKVKTTEHKDTIYNQTFCEELRNVYHCNDEVTLKCKRIGIRYKNPEARTIRFNGHTLHNNKMDWGFAVKWKDKRWGWHISTYHPRSPLGRWPDQVDSKWRDNPAAIMADARSFIALSLGVSIDQIGEDVIFPANGRGIGNITPVYCRWRVVWDEYEFGYTYREIYHVCEEWQEDWNERCRLQ